LIEHAIGHELHGVEIAIAIEWHIGKSSGRHIKSHGGEHLLRSIRLRIVLFNRLRGRISSSIALRDSPVGGVGLS